MLTESTNMLTKKATEIRRNIIKMIGAAGSGHPGGSLSATDIVTYLYFKEMKVDANNPKWDERDRFVLSKGHAAPVLYAALAEKGFFPVKELLTLRQIDSKLQGHPDMKKVSGVEMSTGSLGTGFSTSIGMALAGKLDKRDSYIYVMLGDGELQEGQVWEAAMAASHYKLDNIIAILDNNGLQIDGNIEEVMNPYPIIDKWSAFGWDVIEIDGHDFESIEAGFKKAKETKGKPSILVAKTVKGKGVSFMENKANWHGSAPNKEEVDKALQELQA
ncbi:transketolase subunit A [Desulfonispora thiosulfatigenes DSM 11270]|uniref:Transketolase subunit A n=1 Tax=Desulfonispora thiosulfatigenes DSM 11270 TaxID=656914 RepID=A0A1W1UWU5_DESTI|nr:transketolase [Desulfonispora thiosulfatigenes]SMB85618.1 transketolase subunit A [Desulfonispora thiosulfatigenes DSM 11270]